MEANKIVLNNQTLIDLTQDDVEPSDVTQGKWVHLASGERVQGTNQGGGGSAFAPDFKLFMTGNSNLTMDLTGLETSNMTDMSYMLNTNSNVTEFDLSGFVTNNAITMQGMLSLCSSLTTLTLGVGFVTTNADVTAMFANCIALTTINYAGTSTQFNTNCANMKDELSYEIGIGRTVTVHCSDGDITIQGQSRPYIVSAIGTINNTVWDTDFDFTDNGNNNYTYNNLSLTTNNMFLIRANHNWDEQISATYGNISYIGFPNNNDYSSYITPDSDNQSAFKTIQNCTINIEVQRDTNDFETSAVTITYVS